MYAKHIWHKVRTSTKGRDKICKNCEFNFDGICAAHDSYWGYGKKIKDENQKCSEWNYSLDLFISLAEK